MEGQLCSSCKIRPAMPAGTTCDVCRESVRRCDRKRRVEARENGLCARCCVREPETGRSMCCRCLQADVVLNAKRRSTEAGRILRIVGIDTRSVAAGGRKSRRAKAGWIKRRTSQRLPYQHDQHVERFGPLTEGAVIDHLIPLRVLERSDGSLDFDGLEMVGHLANIRVTTYSDNTSKGRNLDRRILAHARQLRERGLDSIDLIEALLDYMVEIGERHLNDSEMRERAAYLRRCFAPMGQPARPADG